MKICGDFVILVFCTINLNVFKNRLAVLCVHHNACLMNRHRAAKAVYYFALAVNTAAQEREEKRMKALRDAEVMVQREQEKSKRLVDFFIFDLQLLLIKIESTLINRLLSAI